MKLYDLSQPLNQDAPFWPFYPPFEVKYIKRKAEHGVNAQYIQTSNHMGTHLDAPRHFVTGGKTVDQIPLEWLYGSGVIVDISGEMEELELFTPELLESKADIQNGDILFVHTGWHKHAQFGSEPDEEKYIHRHPGPHFDIVPWLLDKKIHLWAVDMIYDCIHVENLGGDIGAPEIQNKRITLGAFPWKFGGGEAAFCRAVAFVEE
jgi:kynurenine formamidase